MLFRSLFTRSYSIQKANSTLPRRRQLDFKNSKVPSLDDFIFQRKVFKLYRTIIRVANQAPDKITTKELKEYAKSEILVSKNVTDRNEKRYLLSTGQNQFRSVCKSMGSAFPIKVDYDSIK